MRRTVTVTLTAEAKGKKRPKRKKVVVHSLTLERFLLLLRTLSTRCARTALELGRDITREDWTARLDDADFATLTDIACPEEPPRWFLEGWNTVDNFWLLLAAVTDTNDVAQLVGSLDLSGKAREKRCSMEGEVHAICKEFPGLTPPIVKGWYMDQFLEVCEGWRSILDERTGAPDVERKATTLAAFVGIPGVGIQTAVH